MNWTKSAGDVWTCRVPPDASFVITVSPKGDNRWNWSIMAQGAERPMATGIANSLGAAKNVTEQFVKRNGST